MAQKYIVELVDDIDGTTADESIGFGLDGKNYTIDLTSENATKLRAALAPYVAGGRKTDAPKLRAVGGKPEKRADLAAIREWAKGNGYEIADRGRIKSDIVEAYDAAS